MTDNTIPPNKLNEVQEIFDALASLVFAYEVLTDNEISDNTPFQPIYSQLNFRFRALLDAADKRGFFT